MIGGGQVAQTLLGIRSTIVNGNRTSFYLVLDPHYTGSDTNIKAILKKGRF
jgi:hypothetical protein